MAIFARTKEMADRIIAIENENSEWIWKRKKIGFKKLWVCSEPPLDVELRQLKSAEEDLAKRNACQLNLND